MRFKDIRQLMNRYNRYRNGRLTFEYMGSSFKSRINTTTRILWYWDNTIDCPACDGQAEGEYGECCDRCEGYGRLFKSLYFTGPQMRGIYKYVQLFSI